MKIVLTTDTDPKILDALYSVARFHGHHNNQIIDDSVSDDSIVESIRLGRYQHEEWSLKVRERVLAEYFTAYYDKNQVNLKVA